jgi:phenylacetate-CoA ligase
MSEFFEEHLRTLEATERAPPESLARYQAQLLERMVRHAFAKAPFYRDRLACLFQPDGAFDLSRWYEVPIQNRVQAAAATAGMRVSDLDAAFGGVAEKWTSGTTGTPLSFAINGVMSISANAGLARVARWFGLDRSRALASIRAFGNGAEAAAYPNGAVGENWLVGGKAPHYVLNVWTPPEQQIEWLRRVGAPYLTTYPANALALAETVSAEEGRSLGIEMIFGVGETVAEGTHETLAEKFGAQFSARYSCQEVGTLALQCPEEHRYHIAVENALVEIVDDRGLPVPPGERGRVVVTGLYNYATPFIRYELGDVALATADRCRCGRSLPLIGRVEGRVRHAFTFRDGSRFWPRTQLGRQMQAYVPFRRYQMVQVDYERIELRYIPDGSGRTPDVDGLSRLIRSTIQRDVTVDAVSVDDFARGTSGKFEDFISLVSAPPQGAA